MLERLKVFFYIVFPTLRERETRPCFILCAKINKCLGWVPTSPAALPCITACTLMHLTVCIDCWIHSVCLLVPNSTDLSEPLYCLWEILNPHFEIKMLGSILALYRPQRNSLSKAYSLPLSLKKSILSICPVYSSSLSETQRKKTQRLRLSVKHQISWKS